MFRSIIIALVLFTLTVLFPLQIATAQEKNPPARTFQPGFWQPVARVDLERPITINLINQTELVVDYAITEMEMKPIAIEPDQTIILNDIKPSMYIVIYPDSNNPDSSSIYLQYQVNVTEENIVEVRINTVENASQSNRSFNLQETGAIYLY